MYRYFYLLIALSFTACFSSVEWQEEKDEHGQTIATYQVDRKTGKKEGQYKRFSQGVLIEQSHYRQDTLDGVRTLFYDNRAPEIIETYVMGTYEGPFKSYYKEGAVKLEGNYRGGSMESTWIKYYPSGQIMEKVTMADNEESGPFVEYYENGNLKAQGNYLNGDNEHGELLLYDEDGQLERKMQCDQGICHTTWAREKTVDDTE